MSRETDSSSSGPQARGGAAHPPGSEPYPAPAGEPTAQPGEPKTETTLTTRIRINIPGSRPIPPVVVRKPVGEAGGESDAETGGETSGADGSTAGPGGPSGAPGGGAPFTAGTPGPNGAPGKPGSPGPGGPSANGGGKPTSSWFAPRKPPSGGAQGDPAGANGGAPAPGAPAPAGPPRQRTDTPPHGFSADRADTTGPIGVRPGGSTPPSGPEGTGPHGFPAAPPPRGEGPSGPTTGPATGGMPLLPPGFRQQGGTVPPPGPGDTGPQPTVSAAPGPDMALAPGPATAPEPPRTGGPALDLGGPADGPGFPADPAETTRPSADPGPGPAGDRAFGDTLVSGIPRVPAADDDGRPAPSADDHDSRPPAPAPVKRGRSKLVLLGVAAFGVLGVAYGAGLLLDHADVPNGTTVLGVDIGGTAKDEAMNKLDAVLGERARMPLVLEVEGEQKTLKPSVAGLSLDTENTVRGASGRDYNPVSVIGSLLGGARQAEPVFKVDEEKLTAALKDLTGSSGGAPRDGMVKFAGGKAVGVPGKPYKQVDADKGAGVLEDAYRTQVATGRSEAVELPVALTQPSVGQEEIDRAIREFGDPAMSGLVTVRAGDRSIPFSPTGSLPKFLSMKPVNGKLVDTYDLKVLKELYGSTFDGILITRGNGTKTPVTPQDVAGALREALRQTEPAKRVGVIELDPR
ncbi:peptidoglycan binding domain-containing protein [Streptomyces mangrovi]|uniref:peptidoglycan binding domain-containing protein n=1 Tax=Streptomyces mangrovi TaxID=1206892 RepID=UPI00399CA11A